jgi:hypothetical protein
LWPGISCSGSYQVALCGPTTGPTASATAARKRSLVQIQYGPRSLTWHFLFRVLPGSVLRPYNWPYREGERMPRPKLTAIAVGGDGAYCSAGTPANCSGCPGRGDCQLENSPSTWACRRAR